MEVTAITHGELRFTRGLRERSLSGVLSVYCVSSTAPVVSNVSSHSPCNSFFNCGTIQGTLQYHMTACVSPRRFTPQAQPFNT